jgi:mono/diheme cytochrome c family protein
MIHSNMEIMFTGIKHLHLLLVILFVLSTLIKTILLFIDSSKFEAYRAKTKLPEIIVTILFLISGITLIILKGGGFHTLFFVKLGLMIVGIPLTIIGFKKQAKIPALIGTFLFIMTYGMAEMASKKAAVTTVDVSAQESGTLPHGTKLYTLNCVTCHGETGSKNLGGAADLSSSNFTEIQIADMISNGTKKMPAFNSLTEEENSAISLYVKTLQK